MPSDGHSSGIPNSDLADVNRVVDKKISSNKFNNKIIILHSTNKNAVRGILKQGIFLYLLFIHMLHI